MYLPCGPLVVIGGEFDPGTRQHAAVVALVFSPLLLEFILGCRVALYVGALNIAAAVTALILGIIGFAAGITVLTAQDAEFPLGWGRVLIFGTSSALVVAGIVGMERTGRRRVPRPLVALGDASYSSYLCHVPVIAVAGPAWQRLVAMSAPEAHAAALAWGFAIALVAGVASYHLIELPLLRASRRLTHVAIRAPIRYGTVGRSGDPA